MPADNIKRAIERRPGRRRPSSSKRSSTRATARAAWRILVETATDNRNRTAADVRSLFAKSGGQLAGAGAVAWQFEPRGVVAVARNGRDPDEVALEAIDAGADDVDHRCRPDRGVDRAGAASSSLRKALEAARGGRRNRPR